jgi:hypothetical protein
MSGRAAAAEIVGEDNAEALWASGKIDRAVLTVRSMGVDRSCWSARSINAGLPGRWCRFPLELKPEERLYKVPFQANTEEEAADLMNLQGFEVINGFSASLLAGNLFSQAVGLLESALQDIAGLRDKAGDKEALDRLGWRLKALVCFYRNAGHTIQYQDILDRTDYEHPPKEENIYPMDGDQKLREIQNVTRNEIDTVNELVGLPKKPVLDRARSSKEEEDIFLLGLDIVDSRKKSGSCAASTGFTACTSGARLSAPACFLKAVLADLKTKNLPGVRKRLERHDKRELRPVNEPLSAEFIPERERITIETQRQKSPHGGRSAADITISPSPRRAILS